MCNANGTSWTPREDAWPPRGQSRHRAAGKHKPTFTPHVDTGDHVVIVNAEKVVLTGNKMENKTYSTHSGFPGGLKTLTAEHIHRKDPTKLLTKAIEGMLPKNPR